MPTFRVQMAAPARKYYEREFDAADAADARRRASAAWREDSSQFAYAGEDPEIDYGAAVVRELEDVATGERSADPAAADALAAARGYWNEHPAHPRAAWAHEVGEGDTSLGYWPWVEGRIDRADPAV